MAKSILIVDDQNDILDLLKEILEMEGYHVIGLPYTENIINSIALHQPDLLILDFLLAGVNGGELCHQVKVHTLTSNIPVIMLSGYPRVLESLGNYGADAFIAKPFDVDHLVATVKQWINTADLHEEDFA